MTHTKHFNLLILFLSAIILCSWSILLSKKNHLHLPTQNSQAPDVFIKNVIATIYNEKGQPALELVTPKMVHYPQNDITKMVTPKVTLFRENAEPWIINAEFAKTKAGIEEILFWKNVNIFHPTDRQNPATHLKTESLTIYPDKQIASTDQSITFTQPDTTVHAVGMIANMNTGVIQLLSAAQGEYAPS